MIGNRRPRRLLLRGAFYLAPPRGEWKQKGTILFSDPFPTGLSGIDSMTKW
jgi:hypothetical protein